MEKNHLTFTVNLESITPNAEQNIMKYARVSNPANQTSGNTKLIAYCIKNHHWSIFEMANMVIEIKTSRAISAQIIRHRSFCFQEFSQRYAEVQETIQYEARSQDVKNRQNSIDNMSEEDKQWFRDAQAQTKALYDTAIEMGIAKEQARFLLPMSSATTLYMNGTVRSWIHYLQLRCDPSTQLEHREIALAIRELFCAHLPHTAKALGWVETPNK